MQIEIRLFGNLKSMVLESEPSLFFRTISEPATAGQLVKELGMPDDISLTITVNGRHATEDHSLQDRDVISIFPLIAGG